MVIMKNNDNISWEELSNFVYQSFSAVGVPHEDAVICTNVLIETEMRGIETHGLSRLKPFYIDKIMSGDINPTPRIKTEQKVSVAATIDGDNGLGMLVATKAADTAILMGHEHGMGTVSVKNSNHLGALGHYTYDIASADLIGIAGTNSRPLVAPHGSTEPILGTNPMAFAFPTNDDEPLFNFDTASSSISRGTIEKLAREGKATPTGLVIGNDGSFLTDSKKILQGLSDGTCAIVPFGEHKGSGFATVVEILSATLSGASFAKDLGKKDNNGIGHFFIAMNPAVFNVSIEEFKDRTTEILRHIRDSNERKGNNLAILTAGIRSQGRLAQSFNSDKKLDDHLKKDLVALRDGLKINKEFDFEK